MVCLGNANLLIGLHGSATQESAVPSEVSELSVIPDFHPSVVFCCAKPPACPAETRADGFWPQIETLGFWLQEARQPASYACMAGDASRHIRLRIKTAGGDPAIGPGKADLLELIDRTGSISAAAREMGMSFRRAWALVQIMNSAFAPPLVACETGGCHGGGAALTPQGSRVLKDYRAAEAAAMKAAQPFIRRIRSRMHKA